MSLTNFHKDMIKELNIISNQSVNKQENNQLFSHVNATGHRQSINFIKKPQYSFEEIIELINYLDTIWEKSIHENLQQNISVQKINYSSQYIS